MSWWYRHALRPVLFSQEAETAHLRAMRALHWISGRKLACRALGTMFASADLPVDLFGLRFPNPVGLAAGMDKFAEAVPAWQRLGFGFAELGAVTWQAQTGNEPPRLFRAVKDEAIINRMGFNNPGAEALAGTLQKWRNAGRWPDHPVGINFGKSKVTPLERAAEDYAASFRILRGRADFFVVNVSSPNTPNLRQLQEKTALDEILAAIQEVQSPESGAHSSETPNPHSSPSPTPHSEFRTPHSERIPQSARPILIKVAPDLSFEALDEILALAGVRKLAGIVATNTTISRPQPASKTRIYNEAGGLSGRPLKQRSTEIIRHLHRQSRGAIPIIGVGGIFNADDAWEKITAGASLVQVYTGLVYEGPSLAKTIVDGLIARVRRAGFKTLTEAVGTDTR